MTFMVKIYKGLIRPSTLSFTKQAENKLTTNLLSLYINFFYFDMIEICHIHVQLDTRFHIIMFVL